MLSSPLPTSSVKPTGMGGQLGAFLSLLPVMSSHSKLGLMFVQASPTMSHRTKAPPGLWLASLQCFKELTYLFFFLGFDTFFSSWLVEQCRIASVSLMMAFLLLSVSFLLLWVLMERRNVLEEVHLSIQIPRSSVHGFQHCCLDSRWQWAALLSPYCWEGLQDWKCNYHPYMLNCHHMDSHITDAKWVARAEEDKSQTESGCNLGVYQILP